jgi:hypothetical protein
MERMLGERKASYVWFRKCARGSVVVDYDTHVTLERSMMKYCCCSYYVLHEALSIAVLNLIVE